MRIWILTVGEPLPIDPGRPRLLRSGTIAHLAAAQGHDVTWFTSTLEHMKKHLRFDHTETVQLAPNLKVVCLHGGAYKTNISLARLINHFRIARQFRKHARTLPRPDVILCSLPLIELADEALKIARDQKVRVVLDVRDYWPDIWADAVPKPLRSLARIALSPWERMRNRAILGADSVIGITDEAVIWACHQSGRARSDDDFGVPMAYHLKALDDAERTEADAFWQAQKLAPSDTILCFFGTLTVRFKPQFLDLLAAVSGLPPEARGRLKVVMAGTGELLEDLRARATDLPSVVFPGWIDAPKIARLMEMSMTGLLPYPNTVDFMDSLPNKSIEYLAGGLPIVTCLRGKVERLIDSNDCGYFYADGAPRTLTDILARMIEQPDDFRRKGRNARKVYERDFRPEKVYGDLIAHMEELLG